MAGDWIKIRTCLFTHPKVMRIAKHCGWTEEVVVGWLAKVWSWADSATESGHVDSVTHDDVSRVTGAPQKFLASMQSVGWLVQDSTGIVFPDYEEHMGKCAKSRVLAANRKKKQRDTMSRSKRDKSVTREEKRRVHCSSSKSKFEVCVEQIPEAAKKLFERGRPSVTRELAWQTAAVLTGIDPDEVEVLCSKLTSGTVECAGRYVQGMMKRYCRDHGLDWAKLKKELPPCPKVKTAE